LHVLAAIDRDIGAGHERRPVRAQVDDKTANFFGLAEASERDLRQDLSWDSPDDSRTGVNIIAFPFSLEDRREVRTATGTLGQPERWSSGRSGHFPWHWHGSIRRPRAIFGVSFSMGIMRCIGPTSSPIHVFDYLFRRSRR